MNNKTKGLISAGIGSIIIAAYWLQAPNQLYLGIPQAVTVACSVSQALDEKKQPPDGSGDRKKLM